MTDKFNYWGSWVFVVLSMLIALFVLTLDTQAAPTPPWYSDIVQRAKRTQVLRDQAVGFRPRTVQRNGPETRTTQRVKELARNKLTEQLLIAHVSSGGDLNSPQRLIDNMRLLATYLHDTHENYFEDSLTGE